MCVWVKVTQNENVTYSVKWNENRILQERVDIFTVIIQSKNKVGFSKNPIPSLGWSTCLKSLEYKRDPHAFRARVFLFAGSSRADLWPSLWPSVLRLSGLMYPRHQGERVSQATPLNCKWGNSACLLSTGRYRCIWVRQTKDWQHVSSVLHSTPAPTQEHKWTKEPGFIKSTLYLESSPSALAKSMLFCSALALSGRCAKHYSLKAQERCAVPREFEKCSSTHLWVSERHSATAPSLHWTISLLKKAAHT